MQDTLRGESLHASVYFLAQRWGLSQGLQKLALRNCTVKGQSHSRYTRRRERLEVLDPHWTLYLSDANGLFTIAFSFLLRGIILFFLLRTRLGEIWPNAVRDIANVESNETLRAVEQARNLSDIFVLFVGGNFRCDVLLSYNYRFIRALDQHNCGTAWCLCIGLTSYPYSLLVTQSSFSLRGGI